MQFRFVVAQYVHRVCVTCNLLVFCTISCSAETLKHTSLASSWHMQPLWQPTVSTFPLLGKSMTSVVGHVMCWSCDVLVM